MLATLPTPWPALLALSPTPPTAWRTASIGVEPPLEPLLDPFELVDLAFGFDFDFAELADFGFVVLALEALGFAFDFELDDFGFDLLDAPALFEAGCFLGFVSAIFLSPRGVSLLGQVPNPLAANHAECGKFSMHARLRRSSRPRRRCRGSASAG
ncbi:MAG TPA: hypothetical protein VFX35_00250 [Solirubrobacterales bacterium]|nr:hypothetical protein [Solirubrobacterales bacterium]